jgi:hypothetical protein
LAAVARRHEPGGQGVHCRAGPGRPACWYCHDLQAPRAAADALDGQPYDIDETASVIQRAPSHALNERQARHHNLLKIIRTQDVAVAWFFDRAGVHTTRPSPASAAEPLRSANN